MVATDALMAQLYGSHHPYGRPGRGTVPSVEGIVRDDLVGFHRRHVGPAGVRLVVVGDVEAPRVAGVVARAFGDWAHELAPPLRPSPVTMASDRRSERRVVRASRNPTSYGFINDRAPRPRYYALDREQHAGPARSAPPRRQHSRASGHGVLRLQLVRRQCRRRGRSSCARGRQPGQCRGRSRQIDEERRGWRDGMTEAELADSRRYLVGSMPRRARDQHRHRDVFAQRRVLRPGLDFDQRIPDPRAVSLDDVNGRPCFLDPARATIVVAGP